MDAKLGTELNIALDTDEKLREDSLSLNVGYDNVLRRWSLIVRYVGELQDIADSYGAIATKLLGGFGIIEISEDAIIPLSKDSRIIYIEKPREYTQGRASIEGFAQSCMSAPYFDMELRGEGITVAILDSGIDIFHKDFLLDTEAGKITKLAGLWDQGIPGNPPEGYSMGTYFSYDELNAVLSDDGESFLSRDVSGHGTAVAGIITACTPKASLLIVKLDTGGRDEADTIKLMQGIDFAVRYSMANNAPMVINLSYGNNSGDHRGNSVLEQYIDIVSGMSRLTFVVGCGNEGVAGRHSRIIMGNNDVKTTEFAIPFGEGGINIELWKNYRDNIEFTLITPGNTSLGPYSSGDKMSVYEVDDMNIRILGLGPSAINTYDEIFISIIPLKDFIREGIWRVELISREVTTGIVDMWLPVQGATVTNIRFLEPSEYISLTVPSTTDSVITVGAYDSTSMLYAGFSGRGYTASGEIKPDLVAPGVNIDTALVGGEYTLVSGTSFATPFVSSAAAMLMEYGIIRGNDSFLYGQKVKAYLIAGARPVLGDKENPNPITGWGRLCIGDSLKL